jgi:hypothetical protein
VPPPAGLEHHEGEKRVTAAPIHWREKALLRPSELAAVSGRSVKTIRRKIASGDIESRLEDGCRLIPIRAALAFVGEQPHPNPEGVNRGDQPPPTPAMQRNVRQFVARIRRKAG